MRLSVSEAAAGARYQWPAIFERLGITIPPGHRHGPCPFCGGKDRFRMDDLDGRGTWFCNNCGAGDGLDLVALMTGYSLILAANAVVALELLPLTPPAREKWQTGNMDARVKALLRHCQPGDAPYLATRGWQSKHWILTEGSSRTIAGLHFGAGTLVLPVRDTGMRLTGAQFISPEGKKYMLPGSHLKGGFCPVHQATDSGIPAPWRPDINPPEGLIITEGYATALAVSCLHPFPVVTAMSANNLRNVAIACRAQWPGCGFILAGDNDFRSQNNTGLLNAQAAAIAVNGRLAMPPGSEMSDWDEFYRHHGKVASRNAFAQELFNN